MRASTLRLLTHRAIVVILVSLLVTSASFFLSPAVAAAADPGQTIFEQKCNGCHTIGGGRTVGPDLKGVTEKRDRAWLIKTIVEPDLLIAQGDSLAKQLAQEYGMAMPKIGVSKQDADSILAYLGGQSGESAAQAASPLATAAAPNEEQMPATAGNAFLGKDLFVGGVRFRNGAVACIACHDVKGISVFGGGSVGKDVTGAYGAFGAGALRSILLTAPFPVMREAFAGHPLTEAEVDHLLAFLRDAGATRNTASNNNAVTFIVVGVFGLAALMVAWEVVWRGRLRGVRQRLVKGVSK